jgi:hypothetical protein
MPDFMKKNRSKSGVAIRFAEKLLNCNALFCCAQKFLSSGKNATYFASPKK